MSIIVATFNGNVELYGASILLSVVDQRKMYVMSIRATKIAEACLDQQSLCFLFLVLCCYPDSKMIMMMLSKTYSLVNHDDAST